MPYFRNLNCQIWKEDRQVEKTSKKKWSLIRGRARERFPQSPAEEHFPSLSMCKTFLLLKSQSEKNGAKIQTQISLALKPYIYTHFFFTSLYYLPQCFWQSLIVFLVNWFIVLNSHALPVLKLYIHTLCHVTLHFISLEVGSISVSIDGKVGRMTNFNQWNVGGNDCVPVLRKCCFTYPLPLLWSQQEKYYPGSNCISSLRPKMWHMEYIWTQPKPQAKLSQPPAWSRRVLADLETISKQLKCCYKPLTVVCYIPSLWQELTNNTVLKSKYFAI